MAANQGWSAGRNSSRKFSSKGSKKGQISGKWQDMDSLDTYPAYKQKGNGAPPMQLRRGSFAQRGLLKTGDVYTGEEKSQTPTPQPKWFAAAAKVEAIQL